MSEQIRVLVVDDDALVRAGPSMLLAGAADIAIVGEATDLVPLLHERVLLDQRSGGVLERAEDLDDHAVHPAELDRPGLHDLGALMGELEHLLITDDLQLASIGDQPWSRTRRRQR